MSPPIIAIEGNIGVGKSTIVNLLKTHFTEDLCNRKAVFLQEPIKQWENITDKSGISILEKFYSDQKSWAFAFQMMAYISRLSILKKAVTENPEAIIFTERSLFTDKYVFAKMLYDDGIINEIEYQIYLKWFNDFIEDIPIAGIIYLQTSPEICMQRIHKRSRKGESMPLEYLNKCHNYHNNWILNDKQEYDTSYQILTLDCTLDTESNPLIIKTWINQIHAFVFDLVDKLNNKPVLSIS